MSCLSMLLSLESTFVVTDFDGFCGFVFAGVLLSKVNAYDFPVTENFTKNNDVFDGDLIEDIHVVLIVLM